MAVSKNNCLPKKVTPKKVTASVFKASKKKKVAVNAVVKSLREEELDNQKRFIENVETKDGVHYCKICLSFSTLTELLAKSHIVRCGKSKKRGRPIKISTCLECGLEFTSKTDLKLHHRKDHVCDSYTCSMCLKQFSRRPSYIRHIQSHKYLPRLECSHPGCVKTFRYSCDLKRHKARHNRSNVIEKKVSLLVITFQFLIIVQFQGCSAQGRNQGV